MRALSARRTPLKLSQLVAEGSAMIAGLRCAMMAAISSTAVGMLSTARGKERMPVPQGREGGGALKERLTGR
jgi:hypothetical protein